jgi:DnaJ-class molecular chaperone
MSFSSLSNAVRHAVAKLWSPRKHEPCPPASEAAYRLLGLEPGADAHSVRRAFRKLAAAHHPDRYVARTPRERAALTRRFSELTAAYHSIVT